MKVDFRDPGFREDPSRVLKVLREGGAVAGIEGLSSFLVTRYWDCAEILASRKFGFEEVTRSLPGGSDYLEMRRALMIFQNAPEHQASRLEGKRMLNAKTPAEIEVVVRKVARKCLGAFEELGSGDFVGGFARPFAWEIAEEVFEEDLGSSVDLMKLTRELTVALDPLGPANSVRKAGAIFRQLEGVQGCPMREAGDQLLMLVMASTFTTTHILGLVVGGLLADPELSDFLREKQEVKPELVEELFRFFSPVQMTRRVALEEVEVDGKPYPAGTVFWISLRSANHDERAFENPERLDLLRTPNRHLAFGKGAHHCLGVQLARIQLRIFLEEFCGFFPGLDLGKMGGGRIKHLVFQGFDHLSLTK